MRLMMMIIAIVTVIMITITIMIVIIVTLMVIMPPGKSEVVVRALPRAAGHRAGVRVSTAGAHHIMLYHITSYYIIGVRVSTAGARGSAEGAPREGGSAPKGGRHPAIFVNPQRNRRLSFSPRLSLAW